MLDGIAKSEVEMKTPTPKKRTLSDGQLAVVKEEEVEDDGQSPNKKPRKLMWAAQAMIIMGHYTEAAVPNSRSIQY